MEKDNVIDNVEEKEETKEENKSGGFKGWFNKTKSDVKGYLFENKLESAFANANTKYDLGSYKDDSLLALQKTIYGFINETNNLVVYGLKEDIDPYSIIVSSKDDKAFMVIKKLNEVPVSIEIDGTKYIRSGVEYLINENVREVKVIKVNGRYFLYDNPNK